ncbi:restriction endonuclease [Streptosporangium sp. NPDC051022]|uniref:restriction endonuclease n=1 Tax=Streptosporangium sp. NPDC051022 TaxID=3155752 RepID=UPI00341A1DCD
MVGLQDVRSLLGAAKEHKAKRAFLVTSFYFGKTSLELAVHYGHLELIDGAALRDLMAEHLQLDLRMKS